MRTRFAGGPGGNERLTAATGTVLLILLAVLGVTIIRIGQLIWLHLFLGLALIGPVMLKMASTGYRFLLYYTRDATYRRKGPPQTWLRLIAPIVVVTTVGVFGTGVLLLIDGPLHRDPLALIHKVTFIVWIVFTGLHVLGHLEEMPAALGLTGKSVGPGESLALGDPDAGRGGRALAVAGAIVGGLVLAVVLIPDFASWTSSSSAFHHHHHHLAG